MTTVLVDVGRSHIRVVADEVDARTDRGAGLSDPGGPAAAAQVVTAAVREALTGVGIDVVTRLAVCAPGVVTAPDLAQAFADALATTFDRAEVLVVSDSAAWQAGAFDGSDGAVVALGTGAVVVARTQNRIVRLDGRGLLLGDVGGGAWIGVHALRAAADDEAGALANAARGRFGPRASWPSLLGEPDLAARLAAFVPDVVATAGAGDERAAAVLDAAADGVVTTLHPLPAELPTCLVGGIAGALEPRLRARTADRAWTTPVGDAIDGLRALLADRGPFAPEIVDGRRADAADTASRDTASRDTDRLPTEAVAPDTADLDTWPTERLVARLVTGHAPAAPAVLAAAAPLARAADAVAKALSGIGRLVYVGAGTPGRLAVQDAAELVPTFDLDPARAIVLLAGGAQAGATAIEGAEDDVDAAAADIAAAGIGPDDVVVGIAASGRTPYVRAALINSRARGATTVAIANTPQSAIAAVADIAVEVLTGPEVIAGSTRLAAGTAQKIALNTLSTAALVRTGATFGPWMVDVRATNDKLRRRAVRIVRDAAGVDEDRAEQTLTAAGRSVPVALVMLLADVDADTARDRLGAAGSVRAALTIGETP